MVQRGLKPCYAIEIKSSATYAPHFFTVLNQVAADELGLPMESQAVVYGGDLSLDTRQGQLISYKDVAAAADGWWTARPGAKPQVLTNFRYRSPAKLILSGSHF